MVKKTSASVASAFVAPVIVNRSPAAKDVADMALKDPAELEEVNVIVMMLDPFFAIVKTVVVLDGVCA